MRALALVFVLWGLVGCDDAREDAPPAAQEAQPPSAAPSAADDLVADEVDDELQLAEGVDEDEEPIALDQMDEAMLETACFEGRQDACDRLGH